MLLKVSAPCTRLRAVSAERSNEETEDAEGEEMETSPS